MSALLVQAHITEQVPLGAGRAARSVVGIHAVRSSAGRIVEGIRPDLPDRGDEFVQRFSYRRKHTSRIQRSTG